MSPRMRMRVNQNKNDDENDVFRIFLCVRGKYGTKEDSVTISTPEK